MSEVSHLAEAVENHFSSPKASSFVHFVTVSDGLTGAQAAQAPAERFNSVWAVTNHVAFWMDVTRASLVGEQVDLAVWGLSEMGSGWPPLGQVNDASWQAARQRALDVNHALASAIRTLNDESLAQPSEQTWGQPPYQLILSIYSHNSHHTSEILCIRHMLGLWVDHEWV